MMKQSEITFIQTKLYLKIQYNAKLEIFLQHSANGLNIGPI